MVFLFVCLFAGSIHLDDALWEMLSLRQIMSCTGPLRPGLSRGQSSQQPELHHSHTVPSLSPQHLVKENQKLQCDSDVIRNNNELENA